MERDGSCVGISDLIASFLQEGLDEAEDGVLEVQRSDLAQRFNCVPSQINYVMSTRFSPERGYIVESRRGGNGYIRITRVRVDRQTLLMHVINSLGRERGSSVGPGNPHQPGHLRGTGGEPGTDDPGLCGRQGALRRAATDAGPGASGYFEAGADPSGLRRLHPMKFVKTEWFFIGGMDYEMRELR